MPKYLHPILNTFFVKFVHRSFLKVSHIQKKDEEVYVKIYAYLS